MKPFDKVLDWREKCCFQCKYYITKYEGREFLCDFSKCSDEEVINFTESHGCQGVYEYLQTGVFPERGKKRLTINKRIMNREILFRGKRLDNSEWLHGDLMHDNQGGCYIYPIDAENLYVENKVDPDTIGQFTGLCDKNGVKIYEGDIVKRSSVYSKSLMTYYCGVVIFDNGDASFKLRMVKQIFCGEDIGLFKGVDDIDCNFITKVIYGGQTQQEDEYCYEVIGNIHDKQ